MPMRFRKQLAAVAALAAVGGGLALAPSAQAAGTAVSVAPGKDGCLTKAKSYFKDPDAGKFYPQGGYLTTTSACPVIRIKPNTTRYVAVCIYKGGCKGSVRAQAGKWTSLTKKVASGTKFHFSFRSTARSTGQYAA